MTTTKTYLAVNSTVEVCKEVYDRQQNEKRVVSEVVRRALKAGFNVGLYDGEEHVVQNSKKYTDVMKAIMSVDDEYVTIWKDGKRFGWVRLIYANGNDGWDVISDHTTNIASFMDEVQEVVDRLSTAN